MTNPGLVRLVNDVENRNRACLVDSIQQLNQAERLLPPRPSRIKALAKRIIMYIPDHFTSVLIRNTRIQGKVIGK